MTQVGMYGCILLHCIHSKCGLNGFHDTNHTRSQSKVKHVQTFQTRFTLQLADLLSFRYFRLLHETVKNTMKRSKGKEKEMDINNNNIQQHYNNNNNNSSNNNHSSGNNKVNNSQETRLNQGTHTSSHFSFTPCITFPHSSLTLHTIHTDLLFLITKYLSTSKLQNTYHTLVNELQLLSPGGGEDEDEVPLLPTRVDWKGKLWPLRYEEVVRYLVGRGGRGEGCGIEYKSHPGMRDVLVGKRDDLPLR